MAELGITVVLNERAVGSACDAVDRCPFSLANAKKTKILVYFCYLF